MYSNILIQTIVFAAAFSGASGAANITTPLTNISELIGSDVTFSCLVTGVQQSWEFMQWIKGGSEVIAVDNTTLDDTKYNISGYYELTIHHINPEDDDWYSCEMAVQEFEAKLTVSDIPDSCGLWMDVYSGDGCSKLINLTCVARNGRPEAIITWYRGEVDVSEYAYYPRPVLDSDGYGDTWSILTVDEETSMPLLQHDVGEFYTCVVDMPGLPIVFSQTIHIGAGDGLHSFGILSLILTGAITTMMSMQ